MSRRSTSHRIIQHALKAMGMSGREAIRSTAELIEALDGAGLIIMPREPNSFMVDVSMTAMRRFHRSHAHAFTVQRAKHIIRYRAMVEARRNELGLADGDAIERVSGEVLP